MRILHVADFVSEKTGYQDFLLPKSHAKHGHEVHVVTSCMNPPAPNYAASFEPLLGPRLMRPGTYDAAGVTIHRLPVAFEWRDRVILRGLAHECAAVRPDAIFVHNTMTPTALALCRIGSKLNVPLYFDNHSIYSVQNTSLPGRIGYAAFRQVMKLYVAPRATRIFGVANECVDFVIRAQGAPRGKVTLLPLGVDTELFSPDLDAGTQWRDENDIPRDAFVVTQTGKLDRTKDPVTLAEAVARLPPGRRPIYLMFVGAGTPEDTANLSTALGERSPHVIGILPPVEVESLAKVFNGSDVLCYPGGTSMSSLEAAACGRMVIMNDEGVSQWRAELGIGLTFQQGNANDLARVLETVRRMSDQERSAKGALARESALQQFSYDRIAGELEEQMRHDIGARSRASTMGF